MNNPILIVDDELPNCESLKRTLSDLSNNIEIAHSASDALQKIGTTPSLIISDLKMPGIDGIELLKRIKQRSPLNEVIIVTAYGSIPTAVEAMKFGAYDFLTKPLQRVDVLATVGRAIEKMGLQKENSELRQQLYSQTTMIGLSPQFKILMETLKQAARSEANILLAGESGTGKGLAAEIIHKEGARSNKQFVTVNCAALPENLLESELFGHERGAYTGADRKKEGRFEVANGGTIFLDEIGALTLSIQAKLLRVLQDGTFERLGSNITQKVDVRVLSATNENLRSMVERGLFREDLYYRLNVIELYLPPLRERMEDMPLLVNHFLNMANTKNQRAIQNISEEVYKLFEQYSWQGNLRELQNIVERAVVLCKGKTITTRDLPTYLSSPEMVKQITIPIGVPLGEVKRRLLEATLRQTNGNKTEAARLLGINPRTVYRKLSGAHQ